MGGALQAIARSSPARGARVGGGREKGRRRATRKSRGQSQEGGGGDCVTTPYSHDRFVSLATHDGRKDVGGREHSVGRSGNRSHIFPG